MEPVDVSTDDLAFFVGSLSVSSISLIVPIMQYSKKTGKSYCEIFLSALNLELGLSEKEPPEHSSPSQKGTATLISSASRLARVAQSLFTEIAESAEKHYRIASINHGAKALNLGHPTFKTLIENLVHYGLLEVVKDPSMKDKGWKIITGAGYVGENGESLRRRIESALKEPFKCLENPKPLPAW